MTPEARTELTVANAPDDVAERDAAGDWPRRLHAAETIEPMLGELLAALAALEDADKALLLRYDGGDTFSVAAYAGLAPEHAKLLDGLPVSAHPWGNALRSSVAVADAEIEPAMTPQHFIRAAGIRGLHAVPVIAADGTALGVIATLFRRPLQLSSRQERVAALYARQVAWIFSSVRLHEETARALAQAESQLQSAEHESRESASRLAMAEARMAAEQRRADDLASDVRALQQRMGEADAGTQRMRALQEVTAALSGAATAHDVAEIIIGQGVTVLGAYAGSMMLLSGDGQRLELVRAQGYPAEALGRWDAIPLNAPYPLTDAVRHGVSVFVPDDEALTRRYPQLGAERPATETKALAAIPLIAHGRVLGALGLSFRTEQTFDSDVQAFMMSLAGTSAQALDRARLYDETLRAREEAQAAIDELEAHRTRLDTIIEQMPAGVMIAEAPTGRLTRGNERLESITRRPFIASPSIAAYGEWGFASPSGVVLHPEELPLARSILHGEQVVGELLRITRGDGSVGYVSVSSTPIKDRDAQIIAALATITDVTTQRRAEEELRFLAEASSILAASLDYEDTLPTIAKLAVPFLADACIIDVVNEEGEIRRVAAVHRDGERAVATGEALRTVPDPTALTHPVVRALRTGMSDLFEHYPPRTPSPASAPDAYAFLGELRPTSLIVVPLFARGRTRGAITLVIEGDERRYGRAELSLAEEFARRAGLAVDNARLYVDAQGANNAKMDFLGLMSHELRTPLNAIIGYTELMLMGVPAPIPESARMQLERVSNASHHLLHLIDEVLAFSRLERGREELCLGTAQLSELVTEAASVIAPLAVERRLELRVEASSEPVTLETDVGKVRHILVNLLSNAVKFTDAGEIVLTARVDDGDVRFDIRDSGIGIAPQYHERIFEPFWQVEHTASRRIAGTGIGLSVARRLARLLGGDISVTSKLGDGSTFVARIPRRIETPPANAAHAGGVGPV